MSRLSDERLNRLSELIGHFGLVLIASALGPIFAGFDTVGLENIILALVGTIISVILSILLTK